MNSMLGAFDKLGVELPADVSELATAYKADAKDEKCGAPY